MCDMKIYKKSIIIMEINLNEIYNKTDNLDKIQAVIDYFDRYIVTMYVPAMQPTVFRHGIHYYVSKMSIIIRCIIK